MEPAAPLVDPRVRRGSRCPDRPDVSIIILVTTGTGRLRSCIASIDLHAGDRSNVEVVVVANGTPADELHWLIERDDLVLLTSTVNLGFGDHMVVVQDEEELLCLLHEGIDQCSQKVVH